MNRKLSSQCHRHIFIERCQKHTDTLGQRFVPLTRGLAGEDRRAKQVIAGVTVIEYHRAKGEVSMLDLTLPDRIGWNPRIRAIDNWKHRRKEEDRNRELCYLAEALSKWLRRKQCPMPAMHAEWEFTIFSMCHRYHHPKILLGHYNNIWIFVKKWHRTNLECNDLIWIKIIIVYIKIIL